MSRRDLVRCPYCPRTVPEHEYKEHFNTFHVYDWDEDCRREMRAPLVVEVRRRPEREPVEDSGMFEDPG